mmetsp:Transcript_105322/g.307888  ORF Transcript_105322/g.307888 Transcript_105322/m.307888 type:complete len:217 (+) Transcript_105322:133-783(+)
MRRSLRPWGAGSPGTPGRGPWPRRWSGGGTSRTSRCRCTGATLCHAKASPGTWTRRTRTCIWPWGSRGGGLCMPGTASAAAASARTASCGPMTSERCSGRRRVQCTSRAHAPSRTPLSTRRRTGSAASWPCSAGCSSGRRNSSARLVPWIWIREASGVSSSGTWPPPRRCGCLPCRRSWLWRQSWRSSDAAGAQWPSGDCRRAVYRYACLVPCPGS